MKTKKIAKRIISVILMIAMIFSFGVTSALAADADRTEPTAKLEGINQITFSHLEEVGVGESVEYEVTDSHGNPAVISIERVAVADQDTDNMLFKGATEDPRAWKVSYTGVFVNCHFYMTVSNNKVTSVYDEWILTVGYTYSGASLTKESTYGKLAFTATIYGGVASVSCWLKGTVTGADNDITVTYSM